ncbi:cytochrome c-type biogenesis protein [Pelagibacterium montanilacus]|uniref:cytochrome c-type biogenesis protein n=1 Tax=Pelagibacterium montanilacus TaxID=2185280 RepID=UPI000F8DD63A|nr:cytochrome c-type biogenesis protein [Pelagibacterium montanilacus]
MRALFRAFCMALVLLVSATAAPAVSPDELLEDPVLETRARAISANLRCMVCQNQSIDDSDAELARDLRLLVRERLVAGDTDTEVIDYIVARYGEFVLLQPVMALHTIVLWAAAPVILVIGLVAVFIGVRRRRQDAGAGTRPRGLSRDERKALDKLSGQ